MLWNSIMDVAHFLCLHVPIFLGYTFVHTLVFSPGRSDLLPELLKMWKVDTQKPFRPTAYAVGPEFVRGVLAFDRFLLLMTVGERLSSYWLSKLEARPRMCFATADSRASADCTVHEVHCGGPCRHHGWLSNSLHEARGKLVQHDLVNQRWFRFLEST